MARISRDAPCLFITAVSKNRLPVFQSEVIKQILCKALDEARQSAGFAIFAYVIMPDHVHVVTDGARKPAVDYRWSSARNWGGSGLEEEHLLVDIGQISWRSPG